MPSTFERARVAEMFADGDADTLIRSPQAFCLALKAARDRRGISLAQIARSTKVCESHYAALERGDLRSWPKGIFRRAFVRSYVEIIGLPVAETMDEFARVFPDGDAKAGTATDASALRLSFDSSWQGPGMAIASRILPAMVDAGLVLVVAAAYAWLAGADTGTTMAIVSVSYFTLATVLLGDSAAARLMRWRRSRAAVRPEAVVDEPVDVIARAWRSGVNVAVNVFPSSDSAAAAEPVESRLRVRFKLP